MAGFHRVASLKDLPVNRLLEFEVAETEFVLVNLGAEVVAFPAMCTHMDGPLNQGTVEAGVLTCPWHGSQFDARTGAVLNRPAVLPLRMYPVKVEGDDVFVELE